MLPLTDPIPPMTTMRSISYVITDVNALACAFATYIANSAPPTPAKKLDLLLTGAILIGTAALILLYPKFDFGGALMQGVCLVYGLIISCMVGKAVSGGIREKTLPMIIMAVGSVLFYFSDLMLVLRWFADAPRLAGDLCMITYFPAQGLLAASVYFHTNLPYHKEKKS